MKVWMMMLVGVLMLGLVGVAEAKGHKNHSGATQKQTHVCGKIVSVATDGSSIVIQTGKKSGGQQVTVQTEPATIVTIDKVTGKKVTDLTAGLHVKVTPATGVAQTIKAHTHKKHNKNKKVAPTS